MDLQDMLTMNAPSYKEPPSINAQAGEPKHFQITFTEDQVSYNKQQVQKINYA